MNWINELNMIDGPQLDNNFLSITLNAALPYDKEFMYIIILYYSACFPDTKLDYTDMKNKGIKFNIDKMPSDLVRLLSNFVHRMNRI
jgi:hypothetical protein